MTHKRSEIKNEIIFLVNVLSSKYKIYKSRYLPIDHENEFPAICVYVPDETSKKMDSDEGYNRRARAVVAVYVRGRDDVEIADGEKDIDDELDESSTDIENILLTQHQTLNKTIYKLDLDSTQYYVNAEGDQIIGIAILEFTAFYIDSVI